MCGVMPGRHSLTPVLALWFVLYESGPLRVCEVSRHTTIGMLIPNTGVQMSTAMKVIVAASARARSVKRYFRHVDKSREN